MTSLKMTRRALLSSILALILCFSMLLGTTFAWFTDSVTSAGNVIQTGKLEVTLEYKTPNDTEWQDASEGPIFNYNNWEPGYTMVRTLKIENVGTLDLKYVLTIVPYVAAATGEPNLADVIDAYMLPAGTDMTTAVLDEQYYVGTVASLMADKDGAAYGVLYANDADKAGASSVECIIALKMNENAGNEYQNLSVGGGFSVQLLATQLASENDDLGGFYDEDASYPVLGAGNVAVKDENLDAFGRYTIKVFNANTTSSGESVYVGTLVVDADSVETDAENIQVIITKTTPDGNITYETDESVQTYDISVTGIKVGNTTPIQVYLYVGEGLNITHLYHEDEEITDFRYTNGQVIFETNDFSPFSIVVSSEPVDESALDTTVPVAGVQYHGDLVGEGEGKSGLDTVYSFTAIHTPETIKNSIYKNWKCDFYVSANKDIPTGSIILGGNYDPFGWIAFKSPVDAHANESLPLLQGVGGGWTYEAIATQVGDFLCGVADVDDYCKNNGVVFTVQLCLVNPDNANDVIVISTVTYDFATGESNIVANADFIEVDDGVDEEQEG